MCVCICVCVCVCVHRGEVDATRRAMSEVQERADTSARREEELKRQITTLEADLARYGYTHEHANNLSIWTMHGRAQRCIVLHVRAWPGKECPFEMFMAVSAIVCTNGARFYCVCAQAA